MARNEIQIVISGACNSGKTEIIRIIGKAMLDAQLNVVAYDGDKPAMTEFEKPTIYQPDGRPVLIYAVMEPIPEYLMTRKDQYIHPPELPINPTLRKLAELIDLLKVKFPNATDDQLIQALNISPDTTH